MKQSKKILLIMMACTIALSLLLVGCQTSKKPYTTPTPTNKKPSVTTPAPTTPTPTTNTGTSKQMTMRAAAEANKVSGVRSATAVITGKTMYIGLDLNANLESGKSAMVENEVASKVKKLYPTYKIMVSSDVDTVTRIKKVAQGIAAGKPLSSFSTELKDIGTRMTPKTR